MKSQTKQPIVTGRCYCGATKIHATAPPNVVTYCHCSDCRRVTGAPVAAFAAFDAATITVSPTQGRTVSVTPGVTRSFCETCGSPLTGRYDYLPGQVYVAIGLLDQAVDFPPQYHAHDAGRLGWLHIKDDLERCPASARAHLRGPVPARND